MIIQKFENNPILKDTEFKALWTNSFDLENLTLEDVYMISQMNDPERMLPIGTEIATKDYWGDNNPWIVVHYGEAVVYDEKTMKTKRQKGFYLQMKYHCGNANSWYGTSTGVYTLNDNYGAWRVIADGTEGNEYMALYSTTYNQGQRMWVPNVAQVQGTSASCFSYYTDENTYAQRIACHYTKNENGVGPIYTNTNSITIGINNGRANYAYVTAYNWNSITYNNNTLSTNWAPHPRMCCFIKGKDMEEDEA